MKLIKVKNGLLEAENFFLVSSFGDFAGSANVSRDISTGKLELVTNSKIERLFNYNEFVLEVRKGNWSTIKPNDFCDCYVGNNDHIYGIRDDISGIRSYWKLIATEDYLQAYSSADGINWSNVGGSAIIGDITKQGFDKKSLNNFIFDKYELYSNPYITLQNFPEDTICEMYDKDSHLIKVRVFDSTMECKVFLDNNNLEGYFIFKNTAQEILYTTEVITLSYGDVWVISPYNFEILYLGHIIDNINSTLLRDLDEVISIKNIGNTNYAAIVIGTETSGNDLIELSLDGITYDNTLTLDFAQDEEKQIYIRITKNVDNHNFKVRDFQIVINE